MTIDRAALGRSNRRRGADAERRVVAWLREHGWPGAERAVRTGYRTATRAGTTTGDYCSPQCRIATLADQKDDQ